MKTNIDNPQILIIDDEPDIRHLLTMCIVQMGISVDAAKDVAEAHKLLKANHYHFCITDMKLPDGNGLEIVEHCQKHLPKMPIAVITAFGNTDIAVDAMKLGAFDFLAKPVDLVQLRQLIKNAFKFSEEQDAEPEQFSIEYLNGNSNLINQFREQLEKIKTSNAPLILQGAKGTEKERLAQFIHQNGVRGEYQEIYLDCETLEPEEIDALIFDSENKEANILYKAHQSSLIINNIQLLSKHAQKKLLQVLESKSLYIENSREDIIIDTRVIICTEEPLNQYVSNSQLREDLFFRLDVLSLQIPTIAQRIEDLPLLLDIYYEKESPGKTLPANVKEALLQHQYPYNYRELESLIRKAKVTANSAINEAPALNLEQSQNIAQATQNNSSPYLSQRGDLSLDDYITSIEKQEITAALDKTRWNRTEAAKLLGISFRTIRYKIKKLGIE